MKVLIWVHKQDVIASKITDYSYTRPYHDRNDEWVQIQITQDEFVRLEDDKYSSKKKDHVDRNSDEWLLEQYNRNRLHPDQVNSIDQIDMHDEIELEQDNQPFAD